MSNDYNSLNAKKVSSNFNSIDNINYVIEATNLDRRNNVNSMSSRNHINDPYVNLGLRNDSKVSKHRRTQTENQSMNIKDGGDALNRHSRTPNQSFIK